MLSVNLSDSHFKRNDRQDSSKKIKYPYQHTLLIKPISTRGGVESTQRFLKQQLLKIFTPQPHLKLQCKKIHNF